MQSKKVSGILISAMALCLFCACATISFAQQAQSGLSAEDQTRAINLVANLTNKLDAAILRFEQISVRIQARIKEMELQGYNMAEAWVKLNAVDQALAGTRVQMTEMDYIVAIVESENPKEAWATSRLKFIAVKTSLQEIQTALRETITELRTALADGPDIPETAEVSAESDTPVAQ